MIIRRPNDVMETPEQVDDVLIAEIPPHLDSITDLYAEVQEQKRKQARRLRVLLLKHMVHGPCGKGKPTDPCMYNANDDRTNVCHKSFSEPFIKDTLYTLTCHTPAIGAEVHNKEETKPMAMVEN